LTFIFAGIKVISLQHEDFARFKLSRRKGLKGPEVRQDISQDSSSSKSKKLLSRREEFKSKEEEFPQRRRGRQAFSKWKDCWSWS